MIYKEEHDDVPVFHFLASPLNDGVRVWVGEDTTKYIDHSLCGLPSEAGEALADWVECHGKIIIEDWAEFFPARNRSMYINCICRQGYSLEEAEEIIEYIPQTTSKYMTVCVDEMIRLWEKQESKYIPKGAARFKLQILQKQGDVWKEDVISPRAEAARKEGWLEGRAELIRKMYEKRGLSYKEAMDSLEVPEDDRQEIMNRIIKDNEADTGRRYQR